MITKQYAEVIKAERGAMNQPPFDLRPNNMARKFITMQKIHSQEPWKIHQ